MKCINVNENLNALLDGEIEISQKREIERHLENCAFCQAEFRNLQAVGASLRQNLQISDLSLLDEKVMNAFQIFHQEKRAQISEKAKKEKPGWFGIPRLAFAAAFVMFAFATLTAFHIGKMSAVKSETSSVETARGEATNGAIFAAPANKDTARIQTIEIPVIKERIVKIPVVQEKIITRVVYKNMSTKSEKACEKQNAVPQNYETDPLTVKSRLKDNQFSTQINLEGFQLVSDLKPQIIKGENNEK